MARYYDTRTHKLGGVDTSYTTHHLQFDWQNACSLRLCRPPAPFSPLLAQLADRAGMMVSPKAAQAAGDKFGANPVCSGPFKFVERVAQDRIVLEKYPNYWNKGEIHVDKIVYLPIVDSTVRLANLKSGQLDFVERVAPSDVPALKTDARFKISKITEIGYQGITINVGNN